MEQTIRMTNRQAAEYHKIIHRYGERIEREARRNTRYWDQSAQRIFKLRMERDRKLQRILSPSQFRLYVRLVRETPTRIHDWRGWYNNPNYPHYHPSSACCRYEDHYWHCEWEYAGNRWIDRFDGGNWHPGKYDRREHDGKGRPERRDRYDRSPRREIRPEFDSHRSKSNKEKYKQHDRKRMKTEKRGKSERD